MEFTFLQLKVEVMLLESLEDLLHMVVMFSQVLGVNEDVVDVHYDKSLEELLEHLVHEALEDRQ